jgi:hypothetical protein
MEKIQKPSNSGLYLTFLFRNPGHYNPVDVSTICLRNVGVQLPDYTASDPSENILHRDSFKSYN